MSHAAGARVGMVTAILTVLGAVLATFGPAVYRYPPPATMPTGSASLWSAGAPIELLTLNALEVAASLALLAAVFGRGRLPGATALAWAAAFILAAGAVVTLPGNSTVVTPVLLAADIPDSLGIGVYFVPAAFCALLTALVASVTRQRTPAVPVAWTREPGR